VGLVGELHPHGHSLLALLLQLFLALVDLLDLSVLVIQLSCQQGDPASEFFDFVVREEPFGFLLDLLELAEPLPVEAADLFLQPLPLLFSLSQVLHLQVRIQVLSIHLGLQDHLSLRSQKLQLAFILLRFQN